MQKTIFISLALSALVSSSAFAVKAPCEGKKTKGISHCQGEKFVCKNGTVSKSALNCKTYANGKYLLGKDKRK